VVVLCVSVCVCACALGLRQDAPYVQLALSLHAPTQELRAQIVPAARSFKLPKLMAALDHYMAACGQRAMIEYVLLAGVNDQPEHAHQLGQLLQERNVMVNLIPYNSTDVGIPYKAPSKSVQEEFVRILKQYNLLTTVRQEMGQDIAGACGQLAIKTVSASGSSCSSDCGAGGSPEVPVTGGVGDIEDIGCACSQHQGTSAASASVQDEVCEAEDSAESIDGAAAVQLLVMTLMMALTLLALQQFWSHR